ncbi:cytochrome C biogenesis protein [Candidatus Nomurabacteria bacterium CG22_combo_CG10-13_8_21_14_all_32_8]|uniref:Cytochrome C biogenesis protein n=3 Tax=Candidatus Nomuraibacteriota TaxID=1752729 RepID=A0A2H0CFK9_9BACT|nr:MAG: cytochrome C biogenesis protein [Candidatus Nomurabacteria bacterium CG22_combo_CG10-13_8_21_14_all_32_8]PIZ85319.1 MAG: cytochrome C biogenesis protein [Candidatus Nomurabacteria bacterium CG_4_10_14_0_2_um_filter_33_9]
MLFFLISILAGVLTILAPCILPLLPVVIGTADGTTRGVSKRAVVVITSLSISVIIFTLLLKATTLFITIPDSFWTWFSGSIITFLGIVTIFPSLWNKIPFVNKINLASNKVLGTGYQKDSYYGDMIIGASLGPIFTTCSPTYLFILATVLPASSINGFTYLIGFTLGLAISLFIIAYLGQKFVHKIFTNENRTTKLKKIFGIIFLIVGIAIITGYDKRLSSLTLDTGFGGTINFEEKLINSVNK